MIVGHSLGGDCGHIKAYGLAPFPHQSRNSELKACWADMPYRYTGENTDYAHLNMSDAVHFDV